MANSNASPISIAVDADVLFNLARLNNANYDPDGYLYNLYKTNQLLPSRFYNMRADELPPLLQDKYFGYYEKMDGNYYYSRLINTYRLLDFVKGGKVKVYVVPTVYRQINTNEESTMEFVSNYCTVVKVKDSEYSDFKRAKLELADKYCSERKMKFEYSAYLDRIVPSSDAIIMAEASILGLQLVTANEKDFIHYDVKSKDYKRTNAIENINIESGYVFISNAGRPTSVHPSSLSSLVVRLRKEIQGENALNKSVYIVNPKVDENGNVL